MQKALQCKKHFGVNPIKTHKIRIFQQRALIEHLRKVGFTRVVFDKTDIVRPIGPILEPFQIKLSARADGPSIWGPF